MCLPGVPNFMCPLLYRVFLCLSRLAQILYFVFVNAPRLDMSAWRVQSGMCSPMHHFCLEGPDFFVLTDAPCLLCLLEGPNSCVLTIAPRVFVSVWIVPTSVLVLTNVSAWRVQSGMCSPMHRFYLEGPTSVCLCSIVHLVCSVCRGVPTPMCSPLHHVFLCLSGLAQILYLC